LSSGFSCFFFSCFTEFSLLDPRGRLEKTTRSSPHHVAQHRPTGSETTPPYAPRSSRFSSEPSSVEDDVDVWRYAILSCMPETTTRGRLGGLCGKVGSLASNLRTMRVLYWVNVSKSSGADSLLDKAQSDSCSCVVFVLKFWALLTCF